MSSDVYETCISGHHKMIISVLRKTFAKCKPKTVFYRYYKNFDQDYFTEEKGSHYLTYHLKNF